MMMSNETSVNVKKSWNKKDMDWSAIQGSILTGGGRLEELFQPPLFPWRPDELPHYHKV